MAQFFKAKPNRSKQLSSKIILDVKQVDHFGAGIAEYQGKVVFISGALPDENVTVQLVEQKKQYARAKLLHINLASKQRKSPLCPHYLVCGGCDMQHVDVNYQRTIKQDTLESMLSKALPIKRAYDLKPAIESEEWHYRRRARLAAVYDKATDQVLLGFRALKSKQVIAISSCMVLDKSLSDLIPLFAELLSELTLKKSLGHLELIKVDNGIFAVLRVTKKVSKQDQASLLEFEAKYKIHILLQDNEGQLLSLTTNLVSDIKPYYQLLDNSRLEFKPGNFIQVNADVNKQMVAQAIDWLDIQPDESVLDLFCGVGNFSLPMAKLSKRVIGVEGVPEMVKQAQENAKNQGINNLSFYHDDLSSDLFHRPWMGKIDKLLLDPARAGAYETLAMLKKMNPAKVLYVSCNPTSLVRDAQLLLKQGYKITRLGLVDMFPQTHHIEAMVLFEI